MSQVFSEKIRSAVVAGHFYPENEKELTEIIEKFLKETKVPKIEGKILSLILPHAGYIFSGFVAAHGYKAIKKQKFNSVILIGDSHCERFDGVSIWEKGEWETPLGKVAIDENLAKEILKQSKRFFIRDSAHLFEHSLEVHLPFLQKILKDFKIVPIVFGSEHKDWEKLAKALLNVTGNKKTLIIGSSDLSHYPSFDLAQKVDLETINSILRGDPQNFSRKIEELEKEYSQIDTFACAQDTIKTILQIAKEKKAKAKLLKYQNSGDTPFGEKSRVVGYGAIAFYL